MDSDNNNKNHPNNAPTNGVSAGLSAQGRAAIPILLGTNRDEDVSFVGQGGGPLDWNMTSDEFGTFAKRLYNFSDAQIQQLQALCMYRTYACLLFYCFTALLLYCFTALQSTT